MHVIEWRGEGEQGEAQWVYADEEGTPFRRMATSFKDFKSNSRVLKTFSP